MDAHESLFELSFYAVHPNTQLLTMLAKYPDDALSLFLPRLWANSEEDSPSMEEEDHLALVKLIFLAKLRMNVDHNIDPGAKELGGILLGTPPYSEAIFDRWWHIEKLSYNGNLRVKAQVLSADLLRSLTANDRPNVEGYIQRMIRQKQTKNESA